MKLVILAPGLGEVRRGLERFASELGLQPRALARE
jgi:hypothetical protein